MLIVLDLKSIVIVALAACVALLIIVSRSNVVLVARRVQDLVLRRNNDLDLLAAKELITNFQLLAKASGRCLALVEDLALLWAA